MKDAVVIQSKQIEVGGRKRLEIDKPRVSFKTLLKPADRIANPLDVIDYTSVTLEEAADGEISAALAAILEERKKKRDDYRLTADTGYWICLCFQSRAQKLEFLKRVGWDKMAEMEKYLDGLRCASSLGVEIEPIELPARTSKGKTPRILRDREVI